MKLPARSHAITVATALCAILSASFDVYAAPSPCTAWTLKGEWDALWRGQPLDTFYVKRQAGGQLEGTVHQMPVLGLPVPQISPLKAFVSGNQVKLGSPLGEYTGSIDSSGVIHGRFNGIEPWHSSKPMGCTSHNPTPMRTMPDAYGAPTADPKAHGSGTRPACPSGSRLNQRNDGAFVCRPPAKAP